MRGRSTRSRARYSTSTTIWAPASWKASTRNAWPSSSRRGIPFVAQKPLSLTYKGQRLRQTYLADFVCFDAIIVELKAVRDLTPEHRAQVLNYLAATGLKLGLLVNFGSAPKARIERLVR